MIAARLVKIAMIVAAMAAGFVAADASEPTIAELVTSLQRIQVEIAAGEGSAYAAQQAQLHGLSRAIAGAGHDHWRDGNEAIALVVYLLSGGDPRDVEAIVRRSDISAREAPLVRGALAYQLGNEREALSLLGDLDPKALDPRMAAHIAFALSILNTKKNSGKASEMLDLARLLAPGGLVEEAALRRAILLATDERDIDRAARLFRDYAQRFPHSLYADGFVGALATTLSAHGLLDTVESFRKLASVAGPLAPASRRAFFSKISRAALLDARFDVAAAAARAASSFEGVEPGDQFYEAAGRALGSDHDAGIAQLEAIVPSRLDARDARLIGAVRAIAAHLRDTPNLDAIEATPADTGTDDAASTTIKSAEVALTRTSGLAISTAGPPQ